MQLLLQYYYMYSMYLYLYVLVFIFFLCVGQPPAFLQCGDFVYPLVPGKSPVLRTSKRAYVFPDTTSDNEGDSVGLMLEKLPREELEELNHVSQSDE